MSKKNKVKVSNDPRVMDASKEISKNSMNSTNRFPKKAGKGEKLKVSQKMLEKVYLDIADSELHEVVDEIVSSDKKHNYKANWKLVNEAGMIILATYVMLNSRQTVKMTT